MGSTWKFFITVYKELFVAKHGARLDSAHCARKSDFKMVLNKVSVFNVRFLSTELRVPACDTADELCCTQFHFYTSSCCCFVSWDFRQIKSGCPRNILEELSLFITFSEELTDPTTSTIK